MPAQRNSSNGRSASAKPQPKTTGAAQPRPQEDPIKHVVVLMLENRSFDQMLGAFQSVYPDLDGAQTGGPPRTNADVDGQLIEQRPVADRRMEGDPKHELPNAINQLNDGNGNFVRDFAHTYPDSDKSERQQIMAYFPVDALPALHTLARQFKVCDRWFSSLPGATWPNRLFVHSGTSIGHGIHAPGRRLRRARRVLRPRQPARGRPARRASRRVLLRPPRRAGAGGAGLPLG